MKIFLTNLANTLVRLLNKLDNLSMDDRLSKAIITDLALLSSSILYKEYKLH